MTASPTTKTGISVSLMRADTVAGDSARISVPSVKISPLISEDPPEQSAAAGVRARFIPTSVVRRARHLSIQVVSPSEWVSRPDGQPLIGRPDWRHLR